MVASPSRVSSSEPDAAEVRASPSISNSGPPTPPNAMIAVSHGISAHRSDASGMPAPSIQRAAWTIASPTPAPLRKPRQKLRIGSTREAVLQTGPMRQTARPTPEREERQATANCASNCGRTWTTTSTARWRKSEARTSALPPICNVRLANRNVRSTSSTRVVSFVQNPGRSLPAYQTVRSTLFPPFRVGFMSERVRRKRSLADRAACASFDLFHTNGCRQVVSQPSDLPATQVTAAALIRP